MIRMRTWKIIKETDDDLEPDEFEFTCYSKHLPIDCDIRNIPDHMIPRTVLPIIQQVDFLKSKAVNYRNLLFIDYRNCILLSIYNMRADNIGRCVVQII